MMVMINFDLTLTRFVMYHRAIFRRGEDAVDAAWITLSAVAAAGLAVVHFVDVAVAETGDLYTTDITHAEVAVQRRRGLKVTIGFQLNLAMLTQTEAGNQGELMRSEL